MEESDTIVHEENCSKVRMAGKSDMVRENYTIEVKGPSPGDFCNLVPLQSKQSTRRARRSEVGHDVEVQMS